MHLVVLVVLVLAVLAGYNRDSQHAVTADMIMNAHSHMLPIARDLLLPTCYSLLSTYYLLLLLVLVPGIYSTCSIHSDVLDVYGEIIPPLRLHPNHRMLRVLVVLVVLAVFVPGKFIATSDDVV
jgi:hypothetical protein